jgi:predicted MFS family arabinose efflux permease
MARAVPRWLAGLGAAGGRRVDALLGGRARRSVIVVLTCALALAVADQGALSATAGAIQSYFGISKAKFGLLGSITTAVSAVATLPFGVYVDRADRSRILAWGTVVWTAATIVSGLATNYLMLLATRVFLGMVIAVAYPAVASLIGDYFPSAERGRIYGFVLSGELIGTGVGVILASLAASVFDTWRAAMLVLALPAAGVSWLVFRLPEPMRGGPSQMPAGQRDVLSARRVREGAGPDSPVEAVGDGPADGPVDSPADSSGDGPVERARGDDDLAAEQVREHGVEPRQALILRGDPSRMGLPAAVRYVLRIRTNAIVIVASALGYFFFSGFRFFGIEWIQQHYDVGRAAASSLALLVGVVAISGVLAGGWSADRLLSHGRINARVVVPAVTFVVAAVLFAPGIATGSLGLALALILPGAFLFAASNPPLDAARLAVMPARLWGRAESVRTVCRGALEASAPVTFGLVAGNVFGGRGQGLTSTFLVMLAPLLLSGVILLVAMRTYPRDVATAVASEEAQSDRESS